MVVVELGGGVGLEVSEFFWTERRYLLLQANLFSKKYSTISQQKFTPKDTTSYIHCVSAVEDFYGVILQYTLCQHD